MMLSSHGRKKAFSQVQHHRFQRIAKRDLPAFQHLGINPQIRMAEMPAQIARRVGIALAGFWVHLGRGAAHDALHDLKARLAKFGNCSFHSEVASVKINYKS